MPSHMRDRWPGHRAHALDLAGAATGQLRGFRNAVAARSQGRDAFVRSRVGLSANVPASSLRQINALSLAFAPVLVVVSGHLQGQFQKHFLHGL